MNWADRQSLTICQQTDYGPKAPNTQIYGDTSASPESRGN